MVLALDAIMPRFRSMTEQDRKIWKRIKTAYRLNPPRGETTLEDWYIIEHNCDSLGIGVVTYGLDVNL